MDVVATRGLAPHDLFYLGFELCEADGAVAGDFFAIVGVRGGGVWGLRRGRGRCIGEDLAQFLLKTLLVDEEAVRLADTLTEERKAS